MLIIMETNENLINSIFEISRLFKEKFNCSDKDFNLTPLQLYILLFLKKEKKMIMKNIADKLMVTTPTATNILDKMVDLKLVERTINKEDRRNIFITLTKKGEETLQNGIDVRKKIISKIFDILTKEEKMNLIKTFNKIKQNYEK